MTRTDFEQELIQTTLSENSEEGLRRVEQARHDLDSEFIRREKKKIKLENEIVLLEKYIVETETKSIAQSTRLLILLAKRRRLLLKKRIDTLEINKLLDKSEKLLLREGEISVNRSIVNEIVEMAKDGA